MDAARLGHLMARITAGDVAFARGGGGGAKSAKGAKGKKAKGASKGKVSGPCGANAVGGGGFQKGNTCGGGARSSQRAAANRVKARLAAKSKTAKAEAAAKAAAGAPKAGIAGMVGRSKQAAAAGAKVQAAKERAALEKRQARNAKRRERRAAKKAAAKPEAPAKTTAPGRGTQERKDFAGVLRKTREKTDSATAFINRLAGPEHNRSAAAGERYIKLHGGKLGREFTDDKGRPHRTYEVKVGDKLIHVTYGPQPTTNPRVQVMGYSARVVGTIKAPPDSTAQRAAAIGRMVGKSKEATRQGALEKRGRAMDALIAKQEARRLEEAPARAAAIKAAAKERAAARKEQKKRIGDQARARAMKGLVKASKEGVANAALRRNAVNKAKEVASKPGRARAINKMTQKSRLASGKAGAANAAAKRAAGEGPRAAALKSMVGKAKAAAEKAAPLNALRTSALRQKAGAAKPSATEGSAERAAKTMRAFEKARADLRKPDVAAATKGLAKKTNESGKSAGQKAFEAREAAISARNAAQGRARQAADVPPTPAKQAVVAKGAAPAKPAANPTPVKPPPASVEARPISDPVRIKAEGSKLDQAFDRAPGAKDNFVSLANLRKTMPHLSRQEFDAVIRQKQLDGSIGLDSHEGLTRPMSAEERAAAIPTQGNRRDETKLLVWVTKRRDD